MRAIWGGALATFVTSASLVGCGGAAAPAKSAPAPAMEAPATNGAGYPSADTDGAPTPTATPPSQLAPAPTPQGTFAPPPPVDRATERGRARDAFARAEDELRATSLECGTACRALGSMARATARICDLADSPDDRTTCERAKKKLDEAKRRVRQSCASCSDGTSLD